MEGPGTISSGSKLCPFLSLELGGYKGVVQKSALIPQLGLVCLAN